LSSPAADPGPPGRPGSLGRRLAADRQGTLVAAALLAAAVLAFRGILPRDAAAWLPVPALAGGVVALGLAAAWAGRRQHAGAPLARDPGFACLVAVLGLLLATLLGHDFRIESDGVDHYVYLRSLAVDHDLDLANDYALLSPRGRSGDTETPLGRTGNHHPVGPALVWSPFYLVADALSAATGRPRDGLDPPYRNAVSIASLLYGWIGLVLLYDTARRFGRAAALLAVLGIAFGTFLYWYLAWAPTMAHAPAFGAAALVVWLWLRPEPESPRRAALLGAACGLAALLRWANVLLALLVIVEALPRLLDRREWPRLLREAAAFSAAALLVFSPQMIVWKLLYGSFLTIPQGPGFVAGKPALGGVLFSPRHGLFSWSPLLYVGLAGLAAFAVRQPLRGLAALAFLAALARVNAGVADWWGGAAFGARRFDGALPLFGLGLALALGALARLARRHPLTLPAALLAGFVAWNLLLAAQWRSGAWDYAEPVTFEEMGKGAVSLVDRTIGSPFSLPASLAAWLRGGPVPADYESLYMQRPHVRWSVRMGTDDRIFLEDGWSEPRTREDVAFRAIERDSAGLVVPLHRPGPYRLGARLRAEIGGDDDPVRVRVLVNQRVVGSWTARREWADDALDVPADVLRPGRNFVRLRRAGAPLSGAAVDVAGLWLAPASDAAAPAEPGRANGGDESR
jgi:hypothetical protein